MGVAFATYSQSLRRLWFFFNESGILSLSQSLQLHNYLLGYVADTIPKQIDLMDETLNVNSALNLPKDRFNRHLSDE
jgi:hypothetical protein